MKKILLSSLLAMVISASAGFANMFYKGNDIYGTMGFKGIGVFMGLGLAALVFGIIIFVFWLLMLIDCLRRDFKKDVEKIAWILVLIFLHILGAIIYYFVVKAPQKGNSKEKKK